MKQHYVPRCYLRRFTNNKKCIFAYDKLSSKQYRTSLMSVCCENDIYTISDEYVKECKDNGDKGTDNLCIEHDYFANDVEPLLLKCLQEIDEIKDEWITNREHYKLTYPEKKELAYHIVTMYFRHPLIKQSEVDNYLRMEMAGIDMMKEAMAIKTGNEEFRKLKIGLKCEKPALHAKLTYMNPEIMNDFAETIAKNIFIFRICKRNDFYTSDFPIVVSPHVQNVQSNYMGLAQYGGEVTFPLSPNLLLSIYDRAYFSDIRMFDCCFMEATEKEVRRQNYLRYMYANRHVFSYRNDFRLIDSVFHHDGKHTFLKPNLKAEIVSGLGKY